MKGERWWYRSSVQYLAVVCLVLRDMQKDFYQD